MNYIADIQVKKDHVSVQEIVEATTTSNGQKLSSTYLINPKESQTKDFLSSRH